MIAQPQPESCSAQLAGGVIVRGLLGLPMPGSGARGLFVPLLLLLLGRDHFAVLARWSALQGGRRGERQPRGLPRASVAAVHPGRRRGPWCRSSICSPSTGVGQLLLILAVSVVITPALVTVATFLVASRLDGGAARASQGGDKP